MFTKNAPQDYMDPEWEVEDKVHNWRNYASDTLKGIWWTFSDVQKAVIAESLQEAAGREEWD